MTDAHCTRAKTFLSTLTEAKTRRQSLRFFKLSLLSFASYLGVTATCAELFRMPPWAAALAAIVLVTVMNFLLLRHYVFEGHTGEWLRQLGRYVASVAAFRLAEYGAFLLSLEILRLPYLLSYAVILFVSFIVKFFVIRNHVFEPA